MTQRNPDLNETTQEGASPAGINNAGGIAPQASSVIGTPAPPPQTIESVGCTQPYTVLNPFGPVDRLAEGAIVFDLPQLVYSQYLDIDQQFEITDDMSPGSMILQIPYHPISDFTNPFIKMYAGFHDRYNGDILYRMQLIGNATYSGTLMWFWYPTKYPTSVVTFAEAQKYEYKTMSVVMPSVEAFVHRDARQYQYYRYMNDADVDNRPHLCLCIHTTVISPLREGIKVRMRIGSKLASQTDTAISGVPIRPFRLANPMLTQVTPDNKAMTINNLTIGEIFPYYFKRNLYGIIDGNTTAPKISYLDNAGKIVDYSLVTKLPSLMGGNFSASQFRRLYSAYLDTSIAGYDVVRIVYVLHQLDPAVAHAISIEDSFANITHDSAKWLADVEACEGILKHVSIYVKRTSDVVLSIFEDPDTTASYTIKMYKQLSLVTNKGMMSVFAIELRCLTNTLANAYQCAIPDTAAGSPLELPHSPVLGPVTSVQSLITLPVPWFGFKFSSLPTTVVTSNDETALTCISDPTILEYFNKITATLMSDQSFQFDLVDPNSKTRVMTLRYMPSFQTFVINTMDNIKYREYQGDVTKLLVANAGSIPTASSMPMTDSSSWPKRFPSTFSTLSTGQSSRQYFRPNAALLGLVAEDAIVGTAEAAESGVAAGGMLNPEVAEFVPRATRDVGVGSQFKYFDPDLASWKWSNGRSLYAKRDTGMMTNNLRTRNVGSLTDPFTDTVNFGTQTKGAGWRPREKWTSTDKDTATVSTSTDRDSTSKYTSTDRDTLSKYTYTDNMNTRSSGTDPLPMAGQASFTQQFGPSARELRRAGTQTGQDTTSDFTQTGVTSSDSYTQMYSPTQDTGIQADLPNPRTKFQQLSSVLSQSAKAYSFLDSVVGGHDKPSDYDRFTYQSARLGMKTNGGAASAAVAGEYNEQMQGRQNSWQAGQNDVQREFEKGQQQQSFQHDIDLQNSTQQFQQGQQQRNFDFQKQQQGRNFDFQNQYQSKQFAQDKSMNNLTFQHNEALSKINIAGNLANTALGGSIGVASNLVGKAADYVSQQKNFQNQKQLQTTAVNNSIYSSGASAQALKVAS